MSQALGRTPTIADLEAFEAGLIQTVLQRMVEVRIGQWYGTVMTVLMEHFDFSQAQLGQFSQLFREKWNEQTSEPKETEGEPDGAGGNGAAPAAKGDPPEDQDS